MATAKELLSAGLPPLTALGINGNVQTIALAGSTQTDATAMGSGCAQATSGSGGCRLPSGASVGDSIEFFNVSGNTASVYPPTSEIINALSANSAISIATAKSCIFKKVTSTTWRTIPLVPS